MIEYIIMISIVLVMFTFAFPRLREALQNLSGEIVNETDKTEPNVPVSDASTTDAEFFANFADSMPWAEIWTGFLIAIGFIGVLFAIFNVVVNKSDASTEPDTDRQEDEEDSEEVENRVVSADETTVEEQQKDIDDLPEPIRTLVLSIQSAIPSLVQYYASKDDTYAIHELNRIQEEEVPELIGSFLHLSEKDQERQQTALQNSLVRLQKQLQRHKTKMEKDANYEFNHNVRLVEKRYND